MTTDQKFWDLIQKVLQRTEKGLLPWEKTPVSNVFQAAFPVFSVRIGQYTSQDPESEPDYSFSIYDEAGKMLDVMTDVTLSKALPQRTKLFDTMSTLYRAARRTALGVDEALDHLLESVAESPDE